MSASRTHGERGSMAVGMIAVFLVGVVLLLGAARVGAALVGRARAETAADAAALAAADALALGASPDQAAADAGVTASDNDARLLECRCAGPVVVVVVAVDVPVVGRVARVSASAEVQGSVIPAP